ncbi:MAG: tRNA 4-thiouridine(8) synthase ThiI [Desulfococcus sp.]|nr:MAG: tRNA 4-thiouridine(8) synthase ThiI [Desulfococcus sp.]
MEYAGKKIRALGLCSGGLDSILSAKILQAAGIDVEWVSFETPFFPAENAIRAARYTNIPLTVRNITARYLPMLKQPGAGYGKNMNPCLDCHALMFRIAGEMMMETRTDFLFSGEVVGQRPMSQTQVSMRYVAKHSGYADWIVRPLSGGILPETIPERKGWIQRNRLQDISGRSRKRQIALAREFGITDYPNPAGGCLLTDPNFSRRLRDLLEHISDPAEADLELLRFGRHFRLDEHTRVIIGKDQEDNEQITARFSRTRGILIRTVDMPAPVALLPASASMERVRYALAMIAGYSKAAPGEEILGEIDGPAGLSRIRSAGISPASFRHLMI